MPQHRCESAKAHKAKNKTSSAPVVDPTAHCQEIDHKCPPVPDLLVSASATPPHPHPGYYGKSRRRTTAPHPHRIRGGHPANDFLRGVAKEQKWNPGLKAEGPWAFAFSPHPLRRNFFFSPNTAAPTANGCGPNNFFIRRRRKIDTGKQMEGFLGGGGATLDNP